MGKAMWDVGLLIGLMEKDQCNDDWPQQLQRSRPIYGSLYTVVSIQLYGSGNERWGSLGWSLAGRRFRRRYKSCFPVPPLVHLSHPGFSFSLLLRRADATVVTHTKTPPPN